MNNRDWDRPEHGGKLHYTISQSALKIPAVMRLGAEFLPAV